MSWKTQLRGDSLPWLLESENPGVRFIAMRDLLDLSPEDKRLKAARRTAHKEGPIWTLLKNQSARVDALGPDNILGFTAGLLVGFLPGATRCSIVTKSPLTDSWGDSNVGGPLATKLKEAGFDAVFVKGTAPRAVYLRLIDGKATVSLDMADSITEWRVSALANSAAGKLGGGQSAIRVFQDFFVDVSFPAELTRGDEVQFPVVVYNYLDEAQTVALTLEAASWYTALGAIEQTVERAAGEVKAVRFPVRVEEVDPVILDLQHPRLVEGRASGDVEGTCTWTIDEQDGWTTIRFLMDVQTARWWMNLPVPFAARIFAAIAGANIPTAQAVVADLTTPENRAKGMGIIGAAFGLGFIFGPAIGGFLSRYGYSVPAFFASGLSLANFAAAWFLLPETLKPEHRTIERVGRIDALRAALARPHLPLLLVIGFLVVAAFSAFESTFRFSYQSKGGT